MVGLVLVSHSHALARAVQELVVAMAGPKLRIAIAAGSGDDHTELGTNAVEIAEAIKTVMSDEGVLVLMDIGSALLSADTALSFLDDAQRARVRCGSGPFVEGAVAAGVVASLGRSLEDVCHEAEGALRQKAEHLTAAPAPAETAPDSPTAPGVTVRLAIPNPHGFHARPVARFIREAAAFQSEIQVRNVTKNRGPVSARSLTSLVSLELLYGHEMEISASGPDAEAAVSALQHAVENGLGDSLAQIPPSPGTPRRQEVAAAPVPVSGGLAIGPLFLITNSEVSVPDYLAEDPEKEIRQLRQAIETAKADVAREQAALRTALGKDEAAIFEAQSLVLDDPAMLRATEAAIRERHENAAFAWERTCQSVASDYAHLEDEYLRQRAADVRDIGARVLAALGIARPRVSDLPQPGILAIDDLSPAEVTSLPKTVLGVICLQGGRTSHAAILLRAHGVPAIAGARRALEKAGLATGSANVIAAFDGDTGELWVDPDPAQLESLRARLTTQRLAAEVANRLGREQAITSDGYAIAVFANLGHAGDAAAALERGAEGVGLFRTEFLFLDRADAPGEDEQYEALRTLGQAMAGHPVIVRTLDIGGDKAAPHLDLPREANPFLGERGIRVSLRHPELFQSQLRAILRAGAGGDFRIMFPMIAELGELHAGRAALEEAHRDLERTGIPHAWPIPVGVMIEVPSAVVLADQLAREADFFSIGTNDLTQYVLAADRGHPALARFQDALHPAVLRMIGEVVAAAHRHGKQVGICGEAASDPAAARLFVGLGIDELSLSPARIPAIKAAIRATAKVALETLAAQALNLSATPEVRALLG